MIIGIDPGKTGAVCQMLETEMPKVLGDKEGIDIFPCPLVKIGKKSEYNLDQMNRLLSGGRKVYIEKAQPMPKQGVVSMFSYGGGYYAWIAFCVANCVPYQLIAPRTWKKVMLRDMKKEKGSSIIKAKQLCPGIRLIPEGARKENHNFAEAFLIAYYGLHYCK